MGNIIESDYQAPYLRPTNWTQLQPSPNIREARREFSTHNWLTPFQTSESAIAPQIEKWLNIYSDNNIQLVNPEQIRDYLFEFPGLAPVIEDAIQKTKSIFYQNAHLALELKQSIEEGDTWLGLYIRLAEYKDILVNEIDEINIAIFDLVEKTNGDFIVLTDYQSPK